MNRSVLDILVKATDRASQVLNGVAQKAGKNLDDVQQRMDRAGQKMTLAVTAPFLAMSGAVTNAAGDLNESVNAINVVFGAGADKIHAYGETAAQAAGLSQRSFNQLVTPIGAMLQNVGFSADEAADSSINLAQRAADMASVFNVDVSEALGAIQAGLRGEADPLERFGVGLNEAAVQAKAVELGLGGAGGQLDANAKAQARLALLMDQTNRIAGDFANTSGEAANQERIMAAEAENAAAKLGQKLLPIKQKIIEILGKAIEAWNGLPEPIQNTVLVLAGVAAAAGPVLFYVSKLIGVVKGMRAAWLAFSTIAPRLGLSMSMALGPIGLVTAAVGLLAAAFATDFLGIRTATEGFVDDMAMNFGDLGDDIHRLADEAGVDFQAMKDRVKAEMEATGASVEEAVDRIDRELSGVPITADRHFEAYTQTTHQHMLAAKGIVQTETDAMAADLGGVPKEGADELLANQQLLVDATTQLVDFMEQALDPAQEMARLQAFLTSRELANGLTSNNPLVRQKAQELKAAAEGRISELNGYVYGANFASGFALGISENQWRAQSAAAGMAQVTRAIMPSSEPKDPRSPFRGITKAWGFMDTLARGLESGADRPAAALSRAMARARGGLSLGAVGAGGGFAGAGMGGGSPLVIHIENFTGSDREIDRFADRLAMRLRLQGV